MDYHLAVDVGGTQIRAASYLPNNLTPHKFDRRVTHISGSTPLEQIEGAISAVWPSDGNVLGIGIATAGPVDPHKGIVFTAPNISGWVNLPLKQLLEDKFNCFVAPGNDANLAALGEWQYGAGQGHHHIIYMTISTGIGGGIIIDDRLLIGQNGLATEIGHIIIDPNGPICGCGEYGHLEAMASGPAIARWVEEELNHGVDSSLWGKSPMTTKEIALAAKQGDKLANEAFKRAGTYIGTAIVNFVHIFNPTIVILGGGVSQTGDLLFHPIRSYVSSHVLSSHYLDSFTITPAALGDESGLMGALALIRQSCPENQKAVST